MKVLYLDQSGQLGGGEIALLPWLRLKREDALVVLFEDGPFRTRLEQDGVAVRVVPMSGAKQVRRESGWRTVLKSVPGLLRMRKNLRQVAREYDVLYANSMKALLVAALVRRWRQPLVWHLRDILSPDHFSTILRRVVVAVANTCASAIIVNSQATADAFTQAGGSRLKTTVVYDGVDASSFPTLPVATIEQLRLPWARPGRTLVGVFSRLSHWKGQHVVLEAVRTLPQVDVLIVGDALFGEAAYARSLKTRAAESDLAGRVTFLGFRADVADLMQTVDIVVHSSTSAEPFGLVIVEGMLAGKPVIATRAGGAVEIIQHDESGLLVSPGSVDELQQAILHLTGKAGEMERLAAAGRLRAQQCFPLEKMFQGIGAVLQRFDKAANDTSEADRAAGRKARAGVVQIP